MVTVTSTGLASGPVGLCREIGSHSKEMIVFRWSRLTAVI